jgi:hypothetical protein
MKGRGAFLAVVTSVSLALGQQQQQPTAPYQPAVPAPSMNEYGGGGWWGATGGVGSTAAGSSMTGMANVISAKGDYNLSTSAAAINMTQAEKQEIQNRQDYTNTYFEMRATNKAARDAERGPRVTAEQMAHMAREAAPKPLSPGEVNQVTGKVNWPDALQMDLFAADRARLEPLLATFAHLGTLDYSDRTIARNIINNMNKLLKSQIRVMPATDYTASKSFLESLMYTTCKCQLG